MPIRLVHLNPGILVQVIRKIITIQRVLEPLFFKDITAQLIKALHTTFHDLWSGCRSKF